MRAEVSLGSSNYFSNVHIRSWGQHAAHSDRETWAVLNLFQYCVPITVARPPLRHATLARDNQPDGL